MEKYLYTVNPRIPIRNVIPGQLITRESNLSLTLDQAKACLKYGPVYRKFANANQSIQVTLENCERLHRRDYEQHIDADSTFIPKEDPVNEKDEVDNKIETLIPEISQEEHIDQLPPKMEFEDPVMEEINAPAEDKVEETPVEVAPVVENETAIEETPIEEKVEETPVVVETPTETTMPKAIIPSTGNENHQNNKKYYNNNNKKYKK